LDGRGLGEDVALGVVVGLADVVGLAVAVALGVAVVAAGAACAAAGWPAAQGSSMTPRDMKIAPASAIASRSENLAGRERISFLVVNE
jgi:hypothetical protein